MDEYASNSDGFGGENDLAQCIMEQIQAQAGSFRGKVARQSADNGNRNRIGQPVLSERFRKFAALDCAGCNAIVSDNGVVFARDIGARGFPFAFQSADFQPIV